MDSLTQIVLGAAVGEAVCGKKIGNKAMVIGAIAGTIPDLDVLLRPFQDLVQELYYHRSLSHSIFFAVFCSPLFAWLTQLILKRFRDGQRVSFKEWYFLYFLGFLTHSLLDCFTTWGTRLFYPFLDYSVAFYSVFVIDPLYTVPFLICLLIAAFIRRENPRRSFFNYLGIGLSSLYLLIGLVNKNIANGAFESSLEKEQIEHQDYISKPTIVNTLLWASSVKVDSGFMTGLYSLFDENKNVKFRFTPQHKELLNPYLPNEKLERLLEITKGYYTVKPASKGVYINDLRFGEFNAWNGEEGEFVFVYHVWEENGELQFEQINYKVSQGTAELDAFWNRLWGKKP